MPTTKDVKQLINAAYKGNWTELAQTSNKIAQKLDKQGHKEDAEWIRNVVNKKDIFGNKDRIESNQYFHISHPTTSFNNLIAPSEIKDQIKQIIKEYKNRRLLLDHGLHNANKILLIGKPGTGKTMTAGILAHELNLPLNTVRQENIITSLMGKTAANLDLVMPSYDEGYTFPAICFFDEFDTFASKRVIAAQASDREYNQITNVLLKEMDHINPDCLMIAASNLSTGFDPAVFRRFDVIIKFPDATTDTVKEILQDNLKDVTQYTPSTVICRKLAKFTPSLIKEIALDAKKQNFLDNVAISDELIAKIMNSKTHYEGE